MLKSKQILQIASAGFLRHYGLLKKFIRIQLLVEGCVCNEIETFNKCIQRGFDGKERGKRTLANAHENAITASTA